MRRFDEFFQALAVVAALFMILAAAVPAQARHHEIEIVPSEVTYVDETRGIKASQGFAGSETRRLDLKVWYPEGGGPWPLIIYSHGTFGFADNAKHLVNALVKNGYIVVAPDYPLTSRNSHTHVAFADISDVREQVRDISFMIDRLLADPVLGKLIDKDRIGTTGHSLGAVTSYFASFGMTTRDPRIKATAPIAGGDPVQTALDNPMGLAGARHAEVSVPVLFLQGDKDVFARMTGRPFAAYARVETPKYELLVKDGYHIAFRDGAERHPEGKNPDCLFFEKNLPGVPIPGCEGPGRFIAPERQQEITRIALLDFFDAYLKQDGAALSRLRRLGKRMPDVSFIFEE